MLNQALNKTQHGLLTEEEQARFCLEAKGRGMYECFICEWKLADKSLFYLGHAYRLKMVPGEIYYCETDQAQYFIFESSGHDIYLTDHKSCLCLSTNRIGHNGGSICVNEDIKILRPANADQREQFAKAFKPEDEIPELITVCDACKLVGCFEGDFFCEDYKTAGTIQITQSEVDRYARIFEGKQEDEILVGDIITPEVLESLKRMYPIDIFKEPDWKAIAKVLKDNGYSIDSLSASIARKLIFSWLGEDG